MQTLERTFFENRHNTHWAKAMPIYLEAGSYLTPIHHPVADFYFSERGDKRMIHVGNHKETAEILCHFLYHLHAQETVRRIAILRSVERSEIFKEVIEFAENNEILKDYIPHFARAITEILQTQDSDSFASNVNTPLFTSELKKKKKIADVVNAIGYIMSKDETKEVKLEEEGYWTVVRKSSGVFDLKYKVKGGLIRVVPVFFRLNRYSTSIEGILGSELLTLDELLLMNGLRIENFVNKAL